MKILCSGNPNHQTVASAVKKQWNDADFASRTTGYDLRFWDPGSEAYFREQIQKYNVFINSSFICGGGQLALLETTHKVWSDLGIRGHIINIGSTAEWLGINSEYPTYSIQKRALRDRSLQLNLKNQIQSTHIIVGGINDGLPEHSNWLNLGQIANAIAWVLEHTSSIPLLQIEAKPSFIVGERERKIRQS
jgi:hypothetical protein